MQLKVTIREYLPNQPEYLDNILSTSSLEVSSFLNHVMAHHDDSAQWITPDLWCCTLDYLEYLEAGGTSSSIGLITGVGYVMIQLLDFKPSLDSSQI